MINHFIIDLKDYLEQNPDATLNVYLKIELSPDNIREDLFFTVDSKTIDDDYLPKAIIVKLRNAKFKDTYLEHHVNTVVEVRNKNTGEDVYWDELDSVIFEQLYGEL